MSRIRERRLALNTITQIDLAERAGVSLATLRNLEQGHNPNKSRARARVEDALTELEQEKK